MVQVQPPGCHQDFTVNFVSENDVASGKCLDNYG